MAKEDTPEVKEMPAGEEQANPQEETVSRAQYEALLQQAQGLANEANHRIAALEEDKRVLQETLKVQNKLVERLFAEKKD